MVWVLQIGVRRPPCGCLLIKVIDHFGLRGEGVGFTNWWKVLRGEGEGFKIWLKVLRGEGVGFKIW